MNTLIIVLLLVVIAVLAYLAFARGRPGQRRPAIAAPIEPPRPPTVREGFQRVQPGDAIGLLDGDRLVAGVLQSHETVGSVTTSWSWIFLDDGRMIEAAPDGLVLFDRTEILYQGTAAFEELAPPAGLLAEFERRVRAGIVGRDPIFWQHDGHRYRIVSTGTFVAEALGERPTVEVWRAISPNPGDNVYFELESVENGRGQVLGVWTDHMALLSGRPLTEADVRGIYAR